MNNNNESMTCKWCRKQFKRRSPKVTHEYKQLCRTKANRTYCSYCSISFDDSKEYKHHLLSEEHIKKLIGGTTEPVIKKTNVKNQLDPFLTEDDEVVLANTKINKVVIKYANDTKEKIDLNQKTETELELEAEQEQQEYLEQVAARNATLSYSDIIQNEIYNRPFPNENQEYILCQLVDANDELSDDKHTLFLQILKDLSEDDADFMTTYIRDCNGLDLESKQIYLELIDKFILKLTQIYNQGYKTIGGKNIEIFISRLSK